VSEYVVYLLTIIYLRMVKFFEVIYLTNLICALNLYYWKSCAMLISVPCWRRHTAGCIQTAVLCRTCYR